MKLDVERLDRDIVIMDRLFNIAVRGLISQAERDVLVQAVKEDVLQIFQQASQESREEKENVAADSGVVGDELAKHAEQ